MTTTPSNIITGYIATGINLFLLFLFGFSTRKLECGQSRTSDDEPIILYGAVTIPFWSMFILCLWGLLTSILLLMNGYDDELVDSGAVTCCLFVYNGLYVEMILSAITTMNINAYSCPKGWCFIPATVMVVTILLAILYGVIPTDNMYYIDNSIFLAMNVLMSLYLLIVMFWSPERKWKPIILISVWVILNILIDAGLYIGSFSCIDCDYIWIFETNVFSLLSLVLLHQDQINALIDTLSANQQILRSDSVLND